MAELYTLEIESDYPEWIKRLVAVLARSKRSMGLYRRYSPMIFGLGYTRYKYFVRGYLEPNVRTRLLCGMLLEKISKEVFEELGLGCCGVGIDQSFLPRVLRN